MPSNHAIFGRAGEPCCCAACQSGAGPPNEAILRQAGEAVGLSMAPSVHRSPLEAGAQITRREYTWSVELGVPAGPISFGFRLDDPFMERPTTPEQKAAIEAAMRLWSNLANVTFTESSPVGYTNDATILFGNYFNSADEAYAFANFPSANGLSFDSASGDVWLNAAKSGMLTPLPNSYEYMAILHEIGHALGLEHPADYTISAGEQPTYGSDALYIEDSRQYTVMTYFAASHTGANHAYQGQTIYASTPLLHDIAAIQRLYGANTTFATGDTIYGFNSNADPAFHISFSIHQVVFSIWDGGGNDTLDLSGYADNQTIDLRQGAFSDVGALTGNVSIAIGAVIENAVGGSGNDTMNGNDSANVLAGGNGNDTLKGGLGSDRLAGGAGNDTFSGSLAELDGDSILDYQVGEVILVQDAQFTASSISSSTGPTVVRIDANLDGLAEATLTLLVGGVGNLMVTPVAGGNSTALFFLSVQPLAHDDAYVFHQGQPFSSTVSNSVLFNDLNATTAALSSGPAHGNLQFAADGSFVYMPAAGFAGVDVFSYQASNGKSSADAQALVYVVPVTTGATTTLNLLALTAEQQIAATYTAFFGRGADDDGFDFWVDQFNAGLPTQGPAALFANIASSFGISDEAKALYPFLTNPFGASSTEITAFIDSVYNNLFNRSSDQAGLTYWTGQVQQTLASGRFVGSVLIDIMSGAQDSAAGKDITSLMGKVAVSLAYVHEQKSFGTQWTPADDGGEAVALLHAVTAEPQTVLTGIAQAHNLVAADLV